MRWTASVAGPGSSLLLTYVHRGLIDGTCEFPNAAAWVQSVQRAGEPFVYGFEPDHLGVFLAERGWSLIDDLSTREALARYDQPVERVPGFYRIAQATITPAVAATG